MELTDTNLALNEPALLSPPTPAAAATLPSAAAPLDQTVLNALSNARDRFLLLRAEAEMERFLADPTMTRLPLTPPYFPPQLNSYQRLLIHRLADTFGIAREVEQPANYQNLARDLPAVVILVKGPDIKLPPVKLATLVPAPTAPATTTALAPPPIDSTPSPPPTETSTQPTPPPVPQFFKILPRSSHPSSSSASSSVADDDGKGKGRKEMTLEERETAYREARERIFNRENAAPDHVAAGANLPRPNSAGSTYSRSSLAQSISSHRISPSLTSSSSHVSSPTPFQHNSTVYYTHTQNGAHSAEGFHRGNLRPSAPSFDPGAQSWSAYSYASTSYQNGEYVAQSSYGEGPGLPYPFPHGANPYLQQQQQQGEATYDPRFAGGHPGYSTSQPPIQIIAASPLPQHAVYPPSFPVPYPSPFVPPPPPPPQQSHYSPSQPHPQSVPPPFASQLWPRQAPLPSPALSASSAGSYAPSTASSTPDRGGYIMRFAEGGVAYSNSSGPPSRSTGSTGSASTSRTASSSNLRNSSSGYGGGSSPSGPLSSASIGTGGSGIGMGDYGRGGIRRVVGAGGGTNLSSPAPSSGRGGGRAMSSSSGSGGNTKRSDSASGSSAAGSDSGRILRGSLVGHTSAAAGGGSGGDGKGKGRQVEETTSVPNPLHPSLPAKPVWASVLPPPIALTNGATGLGAGGGGGTNRNLPTNSTAVAGTTFYPLPPSSAQLPHPHPRSHSHSQLQHQQHQFAPAQDFNSYPPLSNSTPIYSLPHGASTYDRSSATSSSEEIRRPTPRSTALFDPNKVVEASKETMMGIGKDGRDGKEGGYGGGGEGEGLVVRVGGIDLHS